MSKQYSGVFNLQQQMQALTTQSWVTDPYFKNTTLLLQGDDGAGASALTSNNSLFLDFSPNQFPITRNGNSTQGTFTPFSANTGFWSVYFDGSGDRLNQTGNTLISFPTAQAGTNTATIEAMVYLDAYGGSGLNDWEQPSIINKGDVTFSFGANVTGHILVHQNDGTTARTVWSGNTIPLRTWTHVACTIGSGIVKIYKDSVLEANTTWYGLNQPGSGVWFGLTNDIHAAAWNGYISNLRVSNTVRTITIPTRPYASDSDTAYLAFSTSTNADLKNSNASTAVTFVSGTPTVLPFSPFVDTDLSKSSFSSGITGGSSYFDGSGDFVSAADNTALQLGSGDFTMEFWVYFPSGFSGTKWIGGKGDASSAAGSAFSLYSTGFEFYSGSTTYTLTTPTWITGQWYHVAIVRNGTGSNNLKLYINGIVQSQASLSTNTINTGGSNTFKVGEYSSGSPVSYISGFRLVKGTAVYTAAFTPPTAPLTSVANTQLLLNFTNASIIDGTMKSNFETVADSKISTSVVKYGSGSMYFDGTGDWLTTPLSPWMNLGTSDFTMECWVYFTSVSSTQMFLSSNYNAGNGAGGWAFMYRADNTTIKFTCNSNVSYEKTWVPVVGTWYHVAVSRANNNLRMFVDGVQIGTTSISTDNIASASTLFVGSNVTTQLPLYGYMDDARITVGVARYTRNFTPPVAALPRQ